MIPLGIGFLVVAGWLTLRGEREPSYAGRSLSEWIQQYQRLDDLESPVEAQETKAAILRLGTDNLPRLVDLMAYDPAPQRRRVVAVGRVLPGPIRRSSLLKPLISDPQEISAYTATRALQILGPVARPALPELTRLMNDTNSSIVSRRALSVVSTMGEQATFPLLDILRNRQHPNRLFVMDYLANLGTNARALVPSLVDLLEDPEPAMRIRASNALFNLNPALLNEPRKTNSMGP